MKTKLSVKKKITHKCRLEKKSQKKICICQGCTTDQIFSFICCFHPHPTSKEILELSEF